MNVLASFLNRVTMYRLMLYYLSMVLAAAVGLSALNILPYSAAGILLQTAGFVAACWAVNALISRACRLPSNPESSLITGLILAAIIGPLSLPADWLVLVVSALSAIASKYLLTWQRSHVFNPAAAGALVAAWVLGYPASWWIGSEPLLPVVLVGGLLMTQKLRRWHLIVSFLGVYLVLLLGAAVLTQGWSLPQALQLGYTLLAASPLLFFSFVMLVEPLTAPQTTHRRTLFGSFIGLTLFAVQRLAPAVPYSLELALLIGNLAARVAAPDWRQSFVLRHKEAVSSAMAHFWFEPARAFAFAPGQYLEYTKPHSRPDARGIRRYFTIASSPTEPHVLLTSRFAQPGSTFKHALHAMEPGEAITASKVAGDFVLPSDPTRKLAFIAGGIGITPFRSMVKYLLDTNQARDMVLLYAARREADLLFRPIFAEAQARLGLRPVYVLSDTAALPAGWTGRQGVIDAALIRETVPDWYLRLWYISGPEAMVVSLANVLRGLGVPRRHIKRDFFPGYTGA